MLTRRFGRGFSMAIMFSANAPGSIIGPNIIVHIATLISGRQKNFPNLTADISYTQRSIVQVIVHKY